MPGCCKRGQTTVLKPDYDLTSALYRRVTRALPRPSSLSPVGQMTSACAISQHVSGSGLPRSSRRGLGQTSGQSAGVKRRARTKEGLRSVSCATSTMASCPSYNSCCKTRATIPPRCVLIIPKSHHQCMFS